MSPRQKIFIRVMSLILLLLGMVYPSAQAQTPTIDDITALIDTNQAVVFNVSIPWETLQVKTIVVDEQEFTEIEIPGWAESTQSGAPKLPVLSETIGVPFGVNPTIKVQPGKSHQVELSAPILPAPSQKLDIESSNNFERYPDTPSYTFVTEMDPNIYQGVQEFPSELAQITNDGVIRDQRVIGVSIHPVQYNPQSSTVTLYESLKIEVLFEGSKKISDDIKLTESAVYETYFQSNLLNYEQAKQWRMSSSNENIAESLSAETLDTPLWQPPQPGWKVEVQEDGFYQLSYTELQLAGLPVETINPKTFQMFNKGNELAIQVSGEDNLSFDPGDAITFYGEAIHNKYSADNIYWLTFGHENGFRMENRDGTPTTENIPSHYLAQLHFEENQYYRSLAPGDDDLERFLWELLHTAYQASWDYTFTLEQPFTGTGILRANLLGSLQALAIDPDHHVIINLNETAVANVTWDGITWKTVEVEINPDLLQPGENTISFFLPNDTGHTADFIYVDWIELDFPNTFNVDPLDNKLAFTYDVPGTWKYEIGGFSSNELMAYDVSNPLEVAAFNRESLVIEDTGSDFVISFEDEVTTQKDYWVAAEVTIHTILATDIIEDQPSNLHSEENQAEHIVITHQAFWSEAGTLVDHRNDHGLDSIRVDVQDVYDEFNFGIVDVSAIKDFLAYTDAYWQEPAPSYVVLLGDGHYDPKNYLGNNRTSFIPPYLSFIDPWDGETAADNLYITFSGSDMMPDMMLGRMSVNTPAEASAFVEKIIAYETSPAEGDWHKQILAVAGAADSAGDFAKYSDDLINQTLLKPYSAEKVYYAITHTDIAEAVAALKSEINEGKLIVNFIGHGFATGWSAQKSPPEIFIRTTNVPELTNVVRYPIFLAMACSEGAYHSPSTEAFGEVVSRAENKGAIASWSPTGQGVSGEHDFLDRGFFEAVFKYGLATIGEAVKMGQTRLWSSGSGLYLLDTFVLFGDPAVKIYRTASVTDDAYLTAEDFALSINTNDGVLKNDYALTYGNPLTATLETTTAYGTLDFAADGSFTYEPVPDWFGEDSFTYSAYDDGTFIGTATVNIKVHPINDEPLAHPQSVETMINTSLEIFLTGSDIDGDDLTYEIVDRPANGIVYQNIPPRTNAVNEQTLEPSVIYEPNTDFTGEDSFTFRVNDGSANSTLATVSITVKPDTITYLIYLPLIQN